ncbi:MAG: hypothetical protein IPJ31_13575 [Bacteroidetes bacterium]|nr:hypothetical protein [Bacteroidota bacterium]
MASPDTRHYLTHDVFTYITSTIDKSKITDTTSYESKTVKSGDSLFFANGYMIFRGFDTKVHNKNYLAQTGDIAVSATMDVFSLEGNSYQATPTYFIRNQSENFVEDTVGKFNLL